METTTKVAASTDAAVVAQLLHDFNTEFDTPSPGADTLEPRLRHLLDDDATFAILGGEPPVAVALVTRIVFRPLVESPEVPLRSAVHPNAPVTEQAS